MGLVNPSQRKNKNGYYHSFKTQFEGRFGSRPKSRVGLIINSSQYKKQK